MSDENLHLYPGWKAAAKAMADQGLIHYSFARPATWFAHIMGISEGDIDSQVFQFPMLDLKRFIEGEYGYYLQSETVDGHQWWRIPDAAGHIEICQRLDRRVFSSAVRALSLGTATQANPEALLDKDQRKRLEGQNVIRGFRLTRLADQPPRPLGKPNQELAGAS